MIEALRTMSVVNSGGKGRLSLTLTVACGVAISSGILASLIYLLLDLSSMAMGRRAIAQIDVVGTRMRLQSGAVSL